MPRTALDQTFNALETIAFVLPGPWGPIGSAALHLLGGFFGGIFDPEQPDPNKPVLDAIDTLGKTLETFQIENNIKESTNYIASLRSWLADTSTYDDLDSNPATLLRVIDSIHQDLDGPVNQIDRVINHLDIDIPKNSGYEAISQAKLSTLIGLGVSMASILNFRVLLRQKLVTLYRESDEKQDQEALLGATRDLEADFVAAHAFIKSHIASQAAIDDIESRCDSIKTTLQGHITPVTRSGGSPSVFHPHNAVRYWFINAMTGESHGYGNTYQLDSPGPTPPGLAIPPPPTWTETHDARADAEAARAAIIAAIAARCDSFKNDALKTLRTAKAIMDATRADPAPPSLRPDVDHDNDTGWKGAWRFKGKQVRYAVLFQGSTCNTQPSPASDWHLCGEDDSFCPAVSLPGDPSGLAIARIVHREVADDTAGTNAVTYVIPVPNMASGTLVDLCPVNEGDIVPNALIAPVIMYSSYNADQRGRTWPDPYKVRYRYAYTRPIDGAPAQSLAWSPWAVPKDLANYEVDDEGYYYYRGPYYAPQMLVPLVEGCGLVLQRQFKGGSLTIIKSRAVKAKAPGMIFLEDDEGP